jgi:hypothetical protein
VEEVHDSYFLVNIVDNDYVTDVDFFAPLKVLLIDCTINRLYYEQTVLLTDCTINRLYY